MAWSQSCVINSCMFWLPRSVAFKDCSREATNICIDLIMSTAAKPAAAKAKKPAVKTSHPSTSLMVNEAISSLKDRSGSSLAAIKKYLATTYKVDPVKQGHFIRKALKSGVEKKALVQVKGSYKLAKVEKATVKKAAKPKAAGSKTPKKSVKTKKAVKPKTAAKKPVKKAEKPKSGKKPAATAKKPVAKKVTKPAAKKPAKKAAPKKK